MPKNITSRPSSGAARASTCAASWTPWPPMPVMSISRSMPDSCEAERHEASDLVWLWSTAMSDRVVHTSQRELTDERGVVVVSAEFVHAGGEGLEQLETSPREIGRKPVGEPRAVESERSRRLGRVGVARLREDTLDPQLHLRLWIAARGDTSAQVFDELAVPVGENRDEQSVLGREVSVEGLVREPGPLDDVSYLRIDVAGRPHDCKGRVDQPP